MKAHLDHRAHPELLELKGHADYVWSVAFSADGARILTGSWDKTVRVWDAATGREILQIKGHSDKISSVAFSPDGQRLLTGSHDSTARVWDAETGREILQLKGHRAFVCSVAFSADGKRVLTGSYDRTACVWDAATGREILRFKGHRDGVTSAAFSPDGRHILTGSWDATARVWDAATGRETLQLTGNCGSVLSVAFSADGERILMGSMDRTARVLTGRLEKTGRVWIGMTEAQAAERERQEAFTEGIDRLRKTPLAAIAGEARALARSCPERKAELANPLNNAVWKVVDPTRPAPKPDVARQAREAATLMVTYSGGKDGLALDTLAAAHFACGDLAAALHVEREALRLLPGDTVLKASLVRYERLAARKGLR